MHTHRKDLLLVEWRQQHHDTIKDSFRGSPPITVSLFEVTHLVDAVPEVVRDPAHDGSPDLASGHLPQLYGGGLAVERGVRSHNQVGSIFQRGVACNTEYKVIVVTLRESTESPALQGIRDIVFL